MEDCALGERAGDLWTVGHLVSPPWRCLLIYETNQQTILQLGTGQMVPGDVGLSTVAGNAFLPCAFRYPNRWADSPLSGACWGLNLNPVVATVMDQAMYVGPAIRWLVDRHHSGPQDRDELKVEARASSAFMSIQAFIGMYE